MYLESEHDTYIGFHGNGRHARQRVNVAFFRWPEQWQALPVGERCDRLEDVANPAGLFCLGHNRHLFDPNRRRDYLCVSLDTDELGDPCALECFEAGIRLYRKSDAQDVTGIREDDALIPPIACPLTPARIEAWFTQEDQR